MKPPERSYRDELLCACLQLLLAAPPSILTPQELLPPLQLALQIGLSFPPVAAIAISTLEAWESLEVSPGASPGDGAGDEGEWGAGAVEVGGARSDLRSMLPEILPYLEPYLKDFPSLAAASAAAAAAAEAATAAEKDKQQRDQQQLPPAAAADAPAAGFGVVGGSSASATGVERDATGYKSQQRDRQLSERRLREERRQVGGLFGVLFGPRWGSGDSV